MTLIEFLLARIAEDEEAAMLAMSVIRLPPQLTEQEYRAKFGEAPPTMPTLRALAAVYADHPDYRDEWKP